jgi:hypothetical protein
MRLKTTSAQAPWVNRAAIFLGVAILIWMAFENNNAVWTVVFAGCILIVAVAGLFFHRQRAQRGSWWWLPVIGLAAGMALAPLAIFFMAVKTGLHGHAAPDFTSEQILRVLQASPIWAASGLFIGAGITILILIAKHTNSKNNING